jgi:hypothetical protein
VAKRIVNGGYLVVTNTSMGWQRKIAAASHTGHLNVQGQSHASPPSTRLQNDVFLFACVWACGQQASTVDTRRVREQPLLHPNKRMFCTGSSVAALAGRAFLWVQQAQWWREHARHIPAAWRGVSLPGAPWIPSDMFASASALRSARDTGFVSMPCPSAVGASSPIERSAFIVAIMCVPCVLMRV